MCTCELVHILNLTMDSLPCKKRRKLHMWCTRKRSRSSRENSHAKSWSWLKQAKKLETKNTASSKMCAAECTTGCHMLGTKILDHFAGADMAVWMHMARAESLIFLLFPHAFGLVTKNENQLIRMGVWKKGNNFSWLKMAISWDKYLKKENGNTNN